MLWKQQVDAAAAAQLCDANALTVVRRHEQGAHTVAGSHRTWRWCCCVFFLGGSNSCLEGTTRVQQTQKKTGSVYLADGRARLRV